MNEKSFRTAFSFFFLFAAILLSGCETLPKLPHQIEQDPVTLVEEKKKLAEAGDSDAQRDLGLMYFYGEDVTADYAEAARWFTRAAEQRKIINNH